MKIQKNKSSKNNQKQAEWYDKSSKDNMWNSIHDIVEESYNRNIMAIRNNYMHFNCIDRIINVINEEKND